MNNAVNNAVPMDDDLILPAFVAARMAEAVREAPLDPMAERFMKSRLMTRVPRPKLGCLMFHACMIPQTTNSMITSTKMV